MNIALSFSDPDLNFTGTVTVSVVASPTPSRVEYFVDGALKATTTSPSYSWTLDTTLYSDGVHTIKAVAVHKNGRRYETSKNVIFTNEESPPPDSTPPSAPGSFAKSAGSETSITTTWNASTDNVAVTGYRLYRNGAFVTSVSASATSYIFTNLTCGTTYTLGVEAFDAAGNTSTRSNLSAATSACPAVGSDAYLSDLTETYSVNGWGPIEKDKSNGETGAGDGNTITLNGVTFTKGLGVHAYSEVRYNLNRAYSRFRSTIGVDDEVLTRGSVVFEVWGDGVLKYRSPTLTGSSTSIAVDVDITGVNELKLICNDSGDGKDSDHGDWADARVVVNSGGAPLYFNGDFDTGDLSQWQDFHDAHLSRNPPGFQIVGSQSAFQSRGYAAKCIVQQVPDTSQWGDASVLWEGNGGNAYSLPYLQNGRTTWFRYQMLFPNGQNAAYPGTFSGASGTITLIQEWHTNPGIVPTAYSSFIGTTHEGSPHCIIFQTRGGPGEGTMNRFHQQDGGSSRIPLQFNHWYDIVCRITFGPTSSTGSIEWYIDGVHQGTHSVPTIAVASNGSVPGLGHEIGLYRGPSHSAVDTLYLDGVRVGPTKASVEA